MKRRRSGALTGEAHKRRHIELHKALDELVADFISHKGPREGLPSETTVLELMRWSNMQASNPTEGHHE